MCSELSALTEVAFTNCNTTNVTNMYMMFGRCSNLRDVNLSNLNTSSLTDVSYIFYNCYALSSIDMSSFDMSRVTSAGGMFSNCNSLERITAPNTMPSGLVIDLPATYYDSENNQVTQISSEQCNKLLVKTCYIITYELDGGTNDSDNPVIYTEITETIILKNPTKEGYFFINWYADANFKTVVTQIETGSTGDKTLYAKWIRLIKSGVNELQAGEQYMLPEGNWMVEGDSTVYRGDNTVYVSSSSEYIFSYIDGN